MGLIKALQVLEHGTKFLIFFQSIPSDFATFCHFSRLLREEKGIKEEIPEHFSGSFIFTYHLIPVCLLFMTDLLP